MAPSPVQVVECPAMSCMPGFISQGLQSAFESWLIFCGYPPVTKHSNWKSLIKTHGSSLTAAPMEGTWRKTWREVAWFWCLKKSGKTMKSNGLSSCSYWNFGGRRNDGLFSLIRSTRICPSAVELSEESDLIIRLTMVSLVSKNNNKKNVYIIAIIPIYTNNINYMYIQYTWYIISIIHKLQLMPLTSWTW